MRILVVDNYDSFVFNLVQYLGQLGAECVVRRNDDVRLDEMQHIAISGVLLSPGPGRPEGAGVSIDAVRWAADRGVPLLGVCLGHQAIGAAYGAQVVTAPELLHGKTSIVEHTGAGVLHGVPQPFVATRYHSLVVDESTLPSEIEVTARTRTGTVMAMRHRDRPIEGVQFHPESVLTQHGHLMLANWLVGCGFSEAARRAPALVAAADRRREAAEAS